MTRLRVWVTTPELHRRGGTERSVAEQVERWASRFDVCVYATHAHAVPNVIVRKLPSVAGPHLAKYAWWFPANTATRAMDSRDTRPDVTASPGVNSLSADAIGVHIVFGKYWERVKEGLQHERRQPRTAPRAVHRTRSGVRGEPPHVLREMWPDDGGDLSDDHVRSTARGSRIDANVETRGPTLHLLRD